jgi:hypothetical protein
VAGTAEAMFNTLKTESKLSDSDIKERRLSLRLYVYEIQNVRYYLSRFLELIYALLYSNSRITRKTIWMFPINPLQADTVPLWSEQHQLEPELAQASAKLPKVGSPT